MTNGPTGLTSVGGLTGQAASDVGQAAPQWAVTAGLLLLAELVASGLGALTLLRAAHGRPYAERAADVGTGGRPFAVEVVSVRRGIVVLKADGVEMTVDLGCAESVTPVPTCAGTARRLEGASHDFWAYGLARCGFSVEIVFRVIAGRLRSVSGVSSRDLGREGRPCCG
ncbi:hypothetical protein FHS35_001917 [Streptomyces umbrinus]|uniref:hypothetical protein n=2 Tax=Streptomyces umbrinus TaxID=67370 RepID=UPI00167EFF93|nr:hypothetical protein [Streptomyces umbrinus]MCR3725069.1 hypothetical protein [Streptomyces umbrinus]